ncbi:uncharacterized protein [Montipora foliosa]|uniref:uncharacterized protein isoform X2 n=1 Tax=Montipora foliosa TaxID=591990 RepID=UPI0035F1557B
MKFTQWKHDINECLTNPCQHTCTNTFGSYTCQCNSCYTKLGTRCQLRQCRISGSCYSYGTVNPNNQCQNCQSTNKMAWTNNDALSCNDGAACTRNDRCSSGSCAGTPFTCLSCEECYNDACRVKAGFCAIVEGGVKKCFSHGDLRPGYPCQQCDTNNNNQWTNNNNLPCSDNNLNTKNDRCSGGTCVGTPYNCLSCEAHDGSGCPLKAGYCVIMTGGHRTCYAKNHLKPGNPCQWCDPSRSTSTWSNREGVACNDGDLCTRDDTCQSGHCSATPFTCNSRCQYCNGNGCSLKTGFGFTNVCTCKIGGQDYRHQTVNPSNQCEWCDLYDATARANGAWTNRPAVPCDDQNRCTKQDTCNSGRCQGQAYSCQPSFPSTSCIRTSECVGDGTCRKIMRASGTICRPAIDICDRPERCDGKLGTCPGAEQDSINITTGSVQFTDQSFLSVISYQYLTNKLYLRLVGFSASCGQLTFQWFLLSSSSACSTASVVKGAFPNSNTQQTLTGIALQDNNNYKVSIQAVDMRNNIAQLVCSGVIIIDKSKPQGGWIHDGPGADQSYQASKLLQVNWGGIQTRHGVRNYMWKVLVTSFQSNHSIELMSFTNVNLSTSAAATFNSISDGSKVQFVVRAFTKVGLHSDLTSDGFIFDTSAPVAGKAYDGNQTGVDMKYAKWTATFSANWDRFIDPHSHIARYDWAVQRQGAGLITTYKTTALNRFPTATNLNLVSGQSYCAVVKGYNEAGLNTKITSNCLLIDQDSPQAGSINDGHSSDVDYQSEDTFIAANWNGFTDGSTGSGIMEYRYKVTDISGSIIVSWTSAGNATNVTHDGLALMNSTKYFVTVRAIDMVGLSTDVTSDGVTVDTTHPVFTGKVVVTGVEDNINGTPCVYIPSVSTVTVQWAGFSDAHSGLQRYEWAIIPSEKPPSTSSFTVVPGPNLPTSATFQNLALSQGKGYYVIIRAINGAKLYKDAYSVFVIPDATPPSSGKVFDGPTTQVDIDYQADLRQVYGSWSIFPEPNTAVKQYYFAVGSCLPGNYHVTGNGFVKLLSPTATSFTLENITLVNGQRYCIKIKAENKAGLFSSEMSSDGFVADVTPPSTQRAEVRDGITGSDIDYQDNITAMSAQWEGFKDPESGIHHFEYGISRSRGEVMDVVPFSSVGLNTCVTVKGLLLSDDVYYVTVCAVNNALLRKCLSSDGVLIDFSPPSHGIVHDGIIEPDLRYQSSLSSTAANWEGVWDLESGIEKFEWSIGSSGNDKTSIQDFSDVGLSTHVKSNTVLNLSSGTKYYVHLRVTNQAGSVKELVSDGVIADGTPPIPSTIYPGLGSQDGWRYNDKELVFYSASASYISVYWNKFSEPESEVWYYKWAIGISKCGTQIQPLVNIGRRNYANTTMSELVFISGVKYYVTVISRNRAGLVSQSCSDALVFDSTPPHPGKVYAGQSIPRKIGEKYFITDDDRVISWSGFRDRESHISTCNISVVDQSGSVLFTKSKNTSSGNISLPQSAPLLQGQSYNVSVDCFNNVGLASSSSSVFEVDNTPPVPSGPIIVGVSRNNTSQYQSDTAFIVATWPPFIELESRLLNYQFAIGTRPYQHDVVSFKDVHLATQVIKSGLSLSHGNTYYITVVATNLVGLKSNLSSPGLVIDTTPPQAPKDSVRDGATAQDIDYFSPTMDLAAHWEDITDPESGILESKYCLGTKPRGCQIKTTTRIGANKSFSCPECNINPGERVFVTVQATNGAGLTVTRSSNGILMDISPPRIGDVIDGNHVTGVDYNIVLENWNISISWFGTEDDESGIQSCTWKIESSDGSRLLQIDVSNNSPYGQRRVFSLAQTYKDKGFLGNLTYHNVLTCWNKASLRSTARSNGFRVKSIWPIPATVRDGSIDGADFNYTTNTRVASANWDPFLDGASEPVIDYQWAIGTERGKDDILGFTSVGLRTSIEKDLAPNAPGLDILVAGQKYYSSLKAFTASGLNSTASSNGFIVDPSSPITTEIVTSHVVTDQTTRSIEIRFSRDGVKDYESNIRSSEYCLATTPRTCVSRSTTAGALTSGTIGPFVPHLGEAYYVTVFVQNGAGLTSVMSSKKLMFDITPPSLGMVIDGVEHDIDFTDSMDSLEISWKGFKDEESGISRCWWSLIEQTASDNSSAFGNGTVVLTQSVGISGNLSRQNLSLVPGAKYISKITCTNGDGFSSTSSSDGIIVDVTPPSPGLIHDGSSLQSDIQYQSSTSVVEAAWAPFGDGESGVVKYRWGIGTSPDFTDLMNFADVGIATTVRKDNLTLTHGKRYYVTIEATNGAGITSHGWSDGFLVDVSRPELTELSRGPRIWLVHGDSLKASWKSRDPESGVFKTEFCVGTVAVGCQLKSMTELPWNSTDLTCDDCPLNHLGAYFLTVRVTNGAGLFTLSSTEEIKVDLTAPLLGDVIPVNEVTQCVSNCLLIANVTSFADDESGVKWCSYAIRNSTHFTTNYTNIGLNKTIEAEGLQLVAGEKYYVTLRCENNVGVVSEKVSTAPILVDDTPPTKGSVIVSPDRTHDVFGIHSSCHLFNKTLRAYWYGFNDEESGIDGFRIAVGKQPNTTDVLPFQEVGITTNVTLSQNNAAGLFEGDIVYVTVQSRNPAGLVTQSTSPPTRLISAGNDAYLAEGDFFCFNV